jgi:hypothetical protein
MKLYIYELNNGKICKKLSEKKIYDIEKWLLDIYVFRVDNYNYLKLSSINCGDNHLFSFKEYKV